MKIEPVPEIEACNNEAFQWSYIVYLSPPGREKFEEVTTEHLQGQAYAREQEILECQLKLWEMLRPGL